MTLKSVQIQQLGYFLSSSYQILNFHFKNSRWKSLLRYFIWFVN